MSSFKSTDLFGSGPHRFRVRPERQLLAGNAELETTPPSGTTALGRMELEVVVEGRLVATTESGLWALRDEIAQYLSDPLSHGDLEDDHGRVWEKMSLVAFEAKGPVDRGRTLSIGYACTFHQFP